MSEILNTYNEISAQVDEAIRKQPKLEAERELAKKEADKILKELIAKGYEFKSKDDIANIKNDLESRLKLQMESLKRKLAEYDDVTKKAEAAQFQTADDLL